MRRDSGFSITGALVGTAIVAILAAAFASFMNNASKSQKNVQNAVDFDIVKSSLNLLLNSRACAGAFKSDPIGASVSLSWPNAVAIGTNVIAVGAPIQIHKIMQGSTPLVEKNASLGGGLVIKNLEFLDAIYEGDITIGVATYKTFIATLSVGADKPSDSFGAKSLSKTFGVRILAKPSGATGGSITDCLGASTIADVIYCRTNSAMPGRANAPMCSPTLITFTAPECGGKVPDANYRGAISSSSMHSGSAHVGVLQPPPLHPNGPGIEIYPEGMGYWGAGVATPCPGIPVSWEASATFIRFR